MLLTDYIAKKAGDCMAKNKASRGVKRAKKKDAVAEPTVTDKPEVINAADKPDADIPIVKKRSLLDKLKALPAKKKKIYGGVAALLVIILVLWLVPTTKYAILNTVSEADASLRIVDSETDLPVSGALVTLGNGDVATTDTDGIAFFNDTKYGFTTATITKEAYESFTTDVTISKDNVVLGPIKVVSNGVPVDVSAIDWLSNSPIENFMVSSEDGESIFTSEEGVAQLNIPINADASAVYTVRADGYNHGSLTLDLSKITSAQVPQPDPVALVRSGRHSFLSNRDGDISFYSSDYDGGNVEKLVDTGEDGSYFNYLSIPGTEDTYIALLSSENGSDLDQLAYVDLSAKTIKVVDEAPDTDLSFSFVTTDEERVVYTVYFDDDRDNERKVKSYDYASGKLTTLYDGPVYPNVVYDAATNTVVISVQNYTVYPYRYELSRRVLPDGEKEVLTKLENYNLYTPNEEPGTFIFRINQGNSPKRGYYQMTFDGDFPGKYLGEDWPEFEEPDEIPDSEKGLASPKATNRVWVETRDGKGRLILNESKNVVNASGSLSVFSVIRWIDETTLTITGSDGIETADYIIDVASGNYKKITNTFRQSYGGHGF